MPGIGLYAIFRFMELYDLADVPFVPVSHDPALRKRVLFDGGVVPCIAHASHIIFEPGSRASAHAHPESFEVFYCMGGKVHLRVEGAGVSLGEGMCLVVGPGELHSIEDTEGRAELFYFRVIGG